MKQTQENKGTVWNELQSVSMWVIPATLIGISLLITWDYINLAYHWSDDSGMIVNFVILVIGSILIPISINYARKPKIELYKIKFGFMAAIILQIVANWLLFAKFSHIFPFNGEFYSDITTSAGWFTMDIQTMMFLAIWFASTYILLIPFGIGWLVGYHKSQTILGSSLKYFKLNWNLALIVIALLMGLRWGTIWTTPYHQIVYSFILMIIFMILDYKAIQNKNVNSESKDQRYLQPRTAELSLLAMLFVALECSLDGILSNSLYWLILIPVSIGMIIWDRLIQNPRMRIIFSWFLWIASGLSLIALLLANIFYWAGVTTWIWYMLIFMGLSTYPILSLSQPTKLKLKNKRKWRHWLSGFITLISMIAVFGANLYDPFSSYLIIFFVFVQLIISVVRGVKNGIKQPTES